MLKACQEVHDISKALQLTEIVDEEDARCGLDRVAVVGFYYHQHYQRDLHQMKMA